LDDNTISPKGWKQFMHYRYRFGKLKKQSPDKFNILTNRVLADLAELDKAVNATDKNA